MMLCPECGKEINSLGFILHCCNDECGWSGGVGDTIPSDGDWEKLLRMARIVRELMNTEMEVENE